MHTHTYLGRFRPGEAARGSKFYGAAQHKQFTGCKSPSQPCFSDRKTLQPSRRGTLLIWAEIIEAKKSERWCDPSEWNLRSGGATPSQPELCSLLLLLVFVSWQHQLCLCPDSFFYTCIICKLEICNACSGKMKMNVSEHQANTLSGLVNYAFSCCYVILIL